MSEPGVADSRLRELEARIAALESVLRIQGANVTLQVGGTLAISAQTIDAQTSYRILLTANDDVRLRAGSNIKMVSTGPMFVTSDLIEMHVNTMLFTRRLELKSSGPELKITSETNIVLSAAGAVRMSSGTDTVLASGKAMTIKSTRDMALTSRDKVSLHADDEMTLTCKNAVETLKPSGEVEIRGSDIRIAGSSRVSVKGPSSVPVAGTKIGSN